MRGLYEALIHRVLMRGWWLVLIAAGLVVLACLLFGEQ